jgi:ankyrin repeat protein
VGAGSDVYKIINRMTDHGPPPEWDLLLSASQKNNPDRIRALVTEEGVDVSHANQVGQSALHIASLWGHGKVLVGFSCFHLSFLEVILIHLFLF